MASRLSLSSDASSSTLRATIGTILDSGSKSWAVIRSKPQWATLWALALNSTPRNFVAYILQKKERKCYEDSRLKGGQVGLYSLKELVEGNKLKIKDI